MKNKILLITLLIIATLCCLIGCSQINALIGSSKGQNVQIDINDLQTSNVGSIVANNTIKQCVRIEVEYANNVVGHGAGFVITKDGYVVTNRHVCVMYESGRDYPVNNFDSQISIKYIRVVFADSPTLAYEADLVQYSTDKTKDIAVLKIKGFELQVDPIKLDTTSQIYYGQDVYTFGNPEGLGLLFTHLNISSPRHTFDSQIGNQQLEFKNIILLDGNVNHGNSGGVLLNSKGHAIGLIYGRIESQSQAINDVYGIGCALSIKDVKYFIDNASLLGSKVKYITV